MINFNASCLLLYFFYDSVENTKKLSFLVEWSPDGKSKLFINYKNSFPEIQVNFLNSIYEIQKYITGKLEEILPLEIFQNVLFSCINASY